MPVLVKMPPSVPLQPMSLIPRLLFPQSLLLLRLTVLQLMVQPLRLIKLLLSLLKSVQITQPQIQVHQLRTTCALSAVRYQYLPMYPHIRRKVSNIRQPL